MAQNYLYMLEFAVQELVITQGNECAPPEYPLNAEFTFRTGVYVSIPEDDFGSIKDESNLDKYACPPPPKPKVDDGRNKNAQCCLFALEKPVGEDENLMVHVYKKRTEKCKFLIGCTEHRMKEMFDKVMNKYYSTNSNGKTNGNGKKNGDKKNGNGKNGVNKNGNGKNGNGSDRINGAPSGKRLSAGQDDEPTGEAPAEEAAADAAPADDAAPAEEAPMPVTEQATPADAPAEEAPKAQPPSSAAGGAEAGAGGDGEKVDKSKAKSRSDVTVAGGKLDPTHKHVEARKRDVPVSEVRKMGLPLYNMDGKVTGSMVLLIRLSCMGTTVCTSIPYPEQPPVCGPAPKPVCDPLCRPPGTKVCAETCISRVRPCDMMGEDVCPESESKGSRSDKWNHLRLQNMVDDLLATIKRCSVKSDRRRIEEDNSSKCHHCRRR